MQQSVLGCFIGNNTGDPVRNETRLKYSFFFFFFYIFVFIFSSNLRTEGNEGVVRTLRILGTITLSSSVVVGCLC